MNFKQGTLSYLFLAIILSVLLFLLSGNPFLISGIQRINERDSIKTRFDAAHRLWPGERIFVSTDKPLYDKGETIWFSVFLADESRLTQPSQSEIVYVEWINPKGAVEKKLSLIARGGKGNGDIQLSPDQIGGPYKIKAYTRWSESNRQFFVKDIQVQETIIPQLKMSLDIQRQAYKEGDELEAKLVVNQLNNKPLESANLDISLMAGGKTILQSQGKTDDQGQFLIEMTIPKINRGEQPLLSVLVEGNGLSEMISRTVPMVDKEILVYFFPEGGDFVTGYPSKMAFKVLKPDSSSADAEGWLVNQNGEKIQYVKTLHRGMGVVDFTPKPGDQYKIQWKSPVVFTSVLPDPLEKGFALSLVSKTDSVIRFQVLSPFREEAVLVAQMRGRWLWDKQITLDAGANVVEVPISNFQAGVAQFTLFDSRQVPRCERLAFVQPNRKLSLKIKTDKDFYQAREKVNLSIRATDDRGLPVSASISLAVVNDALLSYVDDKQGNILTSLLLEQDLQTRLEDPGFYFSQNAKAAAALDLVMMTYGWRGFSWKKIMDGTIDLPSVKPQKAVLAGVVMDEASGKPMPGAKLTIGETTVVADGEGRFRFPFVDLSVHAKIKIEKEGGQAMEQAVTEYNDQMVVRYWPFMPVMRQDVPMAAMEMNAAGDMNMDKVAVKKGVVKKEANLPMPKPDDQPLMKKAGDVKMEEKMVRPGRPGNPNWGAPPPNLPPINAEPVYHRARLFPNLPPAKTKTRTDFKTTLFWSGLVDLDANGKGNFSFFTGDEVTSYRATAQGIGPDGLIGASDYLFFTELPLSIQGKLPIELSIGDVCKIPVTVSNQGDKSLSVQLEAVLPREVRVISGLPPKLSILPKQKKELLLTIKAITVADSVFMTLKTRSGEEQDEWKRPFRIVPKGYPVNLAFSGREQQKSFVFPIQNLVAGSLKVHATAYPDVTSDLLAGVESILAEPFGCFEQTSMTSYPNVLALHYLRNQSKPDQALVSKAEVLLEKGYKKLVGFETPVKGYEWFGGAPAHEALTAYGLMQFKDMEKVAGYVDKAMVDRTAKWLLSRRDGNGGFLRSPQALDNFGRANDDITNAYIVYSLAEAGFQQLDLEVEKVVKSALEKKDPYVLALATNTLWLMKKYEKAKELTGILMGLQKENGSWMGLTHSITYSQGEALAVETSSFALLALLRSDQPSKAQIDKGVQFLCSQRKGRGGFGNSQATIVALKALTAYVVFSKRAAEDGSYSLTANGMVVAKANWKAGEQKAISKAGWDYALKEGENRLDFEYSQLKDPLPFTIGVNYFTSLPPNDPNTGLQLKTSLSATMVSVGKPVQMKVELKNELNEGRPMTMAVVHIPGGCVVSPVQFKELMSSKKVDFYEVNGNAVFLYFRQMAPAEEKVITINLSPTIRGTYSASASSTYLYYTAERKQWSKPLTLAIN